MPIIYVPRVSGGTLILGSGAPPPPSTIQAVAVQVTFRDGESKVSFKDGESKVTFRDGVAQGVGR